MVEFLNRYISIQKEGSTYGSTGAGGDEVYGEVDDESFQHNYDLLTRQDMSRQIASKSVTGTEYSEGGLNMALQVDDFVGNVLAAFFPVTAYGSDTHSFDEPSTSSHSYNTYTIQVGREQKEHSYTGMVGSRLSMSANVGEYVMLSADFVGCAETHSAGGRALQTPTFSDALDALYFSNGSIVFDDGSGNTTASATVKSFSFEINMNRDTDNAYALGDSTYRRAPQAQRREISGTIELNQVVYGANPTGDDPSYDNLIKADGDLYNPSASTPAIKLTLNEESGSDYIEVAFYKVRFEAPEASVSGRDSNTMTVNFIGLYDAGGADKAMQIKMSGSSLADGTAY